jgi:uncharacterized protein YbjQ (UPF0145 family)
MATMNAADAWVTTATGFEGYRIVRYFGVVRGITVRSASAIGNFTAGLQAIVGGNVTAYTQLAEHSRFEAYELMVQHAAQMGANAIVAMRYDATEVANGMTEVLAYGTAVFIEPVAHTP